MNLVEELVKVALLGATWVLYLLFMLSVISVGVMIERGIFYSRERRLLDRLAGRLRLAARSDDPEAVDAAMGASSGIGARVLREGWMFRAGGSAAFLDGVDAGFVDGRKQLDRGLNLLGTIGNNAPFIGLFGTVIGVIEAFSHLASGEAGAMDTVMSGIAEALVATGVGIFVAVPAVVAFNLLQKRAGDFEADVGGLARITSAWLKGGGMLDAHDRDLRGLRGLHDHGYPDSRRRVYESDEREEG